MVERPFDDNESSDRDLADLGQPVAELRELLSPPDASFLARIRGSIHRRLFVSDAVDFSCRVFFAACLDYLDLLLQSLLPSTRPAVRPPAKEPDDHG
ncbi:MAG: hypothetical protein RBT60_10460 [Candidatus Krumholzibacteria bacterium]|jgi:hypothetical protein|nr:hypothetical protein [Candidatus Krumholzibacteria bacterium]MDY0110347.1 hypothetical protein [Candidatus Krumholzibacteria bacterium]